MAAHTLAVDRLPVGRLVAAARNRNGQRGAKRQPTSAPSSGGTWPGIVVSRPPSPGRGSASNSMRL
jgi:hypothetical protein